MSWTGESNLNSKYVDDQWILPCVLQNGQGSNVVNVVQICISVSAFHTKGGHTGILSM